MQQDPWPTELRLNSDKSALTVTFEGGTSFELSAEFLRVHSPSAEVQGHSPAERRLVTGKRNVKISKLEPVGHYAVRIVFDDRHDTGIFTWSYLYELGRTMDAKWAAYLEELAAKRLSRG